MRLFNRAEPNGYPEDAQGWISAGTLSERLGFVQKALSAGGSTDLSPSKLIQLKHPEAQKDADRIADFFLALLFPSEGKPNLQDLRNTVVLFLNTAIDGKTSSPFANLNTTSTEYENRLRGMVALLMSTQLFEEQ